MFNIVKMQCLTPISLDIEPKEGVLNHLLSVLRRNVKEVREVVYSGGRS